MTRSEVRFLNRPPDFAKASSGSASKKTCLRSQARRSLTKAGKYMFYVYLVRSIGFSKEHYIGFSKDLKQRIADHNSGKSVHTNKFRPWKLAAYFAFDNIETAKNFETYLKTGSGRAFLKKHLI
jgi:putative endonuclease